MFQDLVIKHFLKNAFVWLRKTTCISGNQIELWKWRLFFFCKQQPWLLYQTKCKKIIFIFIFRIAIRRKTQVIFFFSFFKARNEKKEKNEIKIDKDPKPTA
jgi:hypothetical protein